MAATVRLSETARSTLRQLAEETGKPMQMLVDEALDAYRRQYFFAALDLAYEKLWSDAVAGEEELAERALFENTLADGMETE